MRNKSKMNKKANIVFYLMLIMSVLTVVFTLQKGEGYALEPTYVPSSTPIPTLTVNVGQTKTYSFPSGALYSNIVSTTVVNPSLCNVVSCTSSQINVKGLAEGMTTISILSAQRFTIE